ncbi:porin [Hydrogenovibrio halophilus]|uniref:porin n=1 Tax=Hydrogenovibrio halophilus TaxID=373391 RepID=UPI0003651908|nr:porin [Hydrogenovibrio halophilus]
MKKNIVALAVASAIAAPVAMADAPTVYGQVNQALEFKDTKDFDGKTIDKSSGQQVNNIASRLGVKGSSDLGNGMKAVYKVEFSLGMNGNGVGDRNQYVGLAGGFGTVLMGRHDTPFKMAQPKDLFNDGTADFGKLAGGLGAFGKGGENRINNVLAYVSPSFGGVKFVAALSPQEQDPSDYDNGEGFNGEDATEKSSLTDIYSIAAMYGSKKEGLFLSAAMDKASSQYVTKRYTDDDADVTHIRLAAQYAMGGLVANAMYQDFSGDGLELNDVSSGGNDGITTSDQNGSVWTVGAGYKIGKFMPKAVVAMVDRSEEDAAGNDYEDSTNYAVGVNYSLGKKTTAYVDYSMIEHKGDVSDKSDAEETVWSVGLLHKF